MALEQFAERELVSRVRDRPQQADRDRLDLQLGQTRQHLHGTLPLQLAHDLTLTADPLVDLEGQRARVCRGRGSRSSS